MYIRVKLELATLANLLTKNEKESFVGLELVNYASGMKPKLQSAFQSLAASGWRCIIIMKPD